MKKLFSIMAVLWIAIISLSAVAQTTQLATLQHQDQVSIYYGAAALKQAVAAAADGDVITLSSGQFDAPTFDKELTVRGAGMGIVEAPGYSIPTIINGNCSPKTKLTFESIYFNGQLSISYDTKIIKCKVKEFYCNDSRPQLQIISSDILKLTNFSSAQVTAINSIFNNDIISNYSEFRGSFTNCIWIEAYKGKILANYTFTNTIIKQESTIFDTGFAAYNCLVIGAAPKNFPTATNLIRSDLTTVFKEDGYWELLDEFKTFATTDGKEVGIYGGNLGFSQTPNNPQITKFSVAPRTSADGKLSVEIEVEGLE